MKTSKGKIGRPSGMAAWARKKAIARLSGMSLTILSMAARHLKGIGIYKLIEVAGIPIGGVENFARHFHVRDAHMRHLMKLGLVRVKGDKVFATKVGRDHLAHLHATAEPFVHEE